MSVRGRQKRALRDEGYARLTAIRGEACTGFSALELRNQDHSKLWKKSKPKSRTVKQVQVRVRQSSLGPQEYAKYMKSLHWARRRALYFQTHAKKCVVCDTTERIHLHHLTYVRLGSELDQDMRALCEKHHADAHEHHRLFGGTLKEATLRFIDRMRT